MGTLVALAFPSITSGFHPKGIQEFWPGFTVICLMVNLSKGGFWSDFRESKKLSSLLSYMSSMSSRSSIKISGLCVALSVLEGFLILPGNCLPVAWLSASFLISPLSLASLVLCIQWCCTSCSAFWSLSVGESMNSEMEWMKISRYCCHPVKEQKYQLILSTIMVSWKCGFRSCKYFLISSHRVISPCINITVKPGT